MDVEFTRCEECGKPLADDTKPHRCVDCQVVYQADLTYIMDSVESENLTTIDEIVKYTRLIKEHVQRIVKESPTLSHLIPTEEPCKKCGARFAQSGSTFCIECRLELNKSLGEASGDLFEKVRGEEYQPQYPSGPNRLRAAIEEKRARTGSDYIDPAPKFRKY